MTKQQKNQAHCFQCGMPVHCRQCGAPVYATTEFSMWLREQNEIASRFGFVATNIDYMWQNYKSGMWMLLEEKRFMQDVSFSQRKMLEVINAACRHDTKYHGVHLIQFENALPSDGRIYIDRNQVSRERLIKFLRFENIAEEYK